MGNQKVSNDKKKAKQSLHGNWDKMIILMIFILLFGVLIKISKKIALFLALPLMFLYLVIKNAMRLAVYLTKENKLTNGHIIPWEKIFKLSSYSLIIRICFLIPALITISILLFQTKPIFIWFLHHHTLSTFDYRLIINQFLTKPILIMLTLLSIILWYLGDVMYESLFFSIFLLIIDEPKLTSFEVLRRSFQISKPWLKENMQLIISFLPWKLLAVVTLSLSHVYSQPYYYMSLAERYEQMKNEATF
ncbi:MAG: DUF975 family protein [Lactobacillus sp.]|nr:DUF975 family protein [Lactobacillus sp.]MBD5430466.1 DUF975 family protein [Lactobacillus sp.]MBD5430595.1 DUF975 family protein [Lactobacillus sp.]